MLNRKLQTYRTWGKNKQDQNSLRLIIWQSRAVLKKIEILDGIFNKSLLRNN